MGIICYYFLFIQNYLDFILAVDDVILLDLGLLAFLCVRERDTALCENNVRGECCFLVDLIKEEKRVVSIAYFVVLLFKVSAFHFFLLIFSPLAPSHSPSPRESLNKTFFQR